MFTIIYVFIGIGLLAVFIGAVAEQALKEQQNKATNRGEEAEPKSEQIDNNDNF